MKGFFKMRKKRVGGQSDVESDVDVHLCVSEWGVNNTEDGCQFVEAYAFSLSSCRALSRSAGRFCRERQHHQGSGRAYTGSRWGRVKEGEGTLVSHLCQLFQVR